MNRQSEADTKRGKPHDALGTWLGTWPSGSVHALAFAAELEEPSRRAGTGSQPRVTQMQTQVQQGPPANDGGENDKGKQ
jgi:hypothetical protein